MCLAIPGQLTQVNPGDPLFRTGLVRFGGAVKEINLACAPGAKVGDFVLVHVGVALAVLDPEEAAATLRMLREMGELEELTAPGSAPP